MSQQKALVIGVSQYPLPINPLPGVANDVREMADLLGSRSSRFRVGGVTVLTDANATGEAVRRHLESTLSRAVRDDTVFVYMAGHGKELGGSYYFIPHDINPDRIAQTSVSLAELREMFDRSPSRRVFVWLDFCHSGGIVERDAGGLSDDRDVVERTLQVMKGAGKVIVAACTAQQTAKEPKHGAVKHGFFTLALLDGLRGKAVNTDGEVTASTLYEYVAKRVEAESYDQRPVLVGHMEGVIVLMHYADRKAETVLPVAPGGGGGGGVCESSGDWVMVGNLFLPSVSVTVQPGKVVIEVKPRSTAEYAAIQRLAARDGRGDSIPFAHGDDALVARVAEISSRSVGGQQVVTISLTPENVQFGGHMSEMNVQGHSREEIAEMRAGRLLLNNPPPPKTKGLNRFIDDFVETHIRGTSGTLYPAERAVLQEVQAALKDSSDPLLPLARLKLLYAMKASDCVEQVLELKVGPVIDGKCHVRFRGVRARRYVNVEPHVIAVEGDCPLE